jgi:hypothetical protein
MYVSTHYPTNYLNNWSGSVRTLTCLDNWSGSVRTLTCFENWSGSVRTLTCYDNWSGSVISGRVVCGHLHVLIIDRVVVCVRTLPDQLSKHVCVRTLPDQLSKHVR